jgi:pimeloyl-ACP methyl ester carboxylesterase
MLLSRGSRQLWLLRAPHLVSALAAWFWRWVLACEVAIAAAVAALLARALSLSVAAAVAAGLTVLLEMLCAFAAVSLALARAAARAAAPRGLGYMIQAMLTEAMQFGMAQCAMSAEPWLRLPGSERNPRALAPKPVLLIHGVLCNRSIWRGLCRQLAAAGFGPVRALNLEPLVADIEFHATTVNAELSAMQRQSEGARVAIVAHSMGGLVARAALRLDGTAVISRIVTIATPHHGTAIARCARYRPARQMCPESDWLRELNASQEGRLRVPITCIYSLDDNLIAPALSATLQGAEAHEMRGLGHFGLLRSRRVLNCVVTALERG